MADDVQPEVVREPFTGALEVEGDYELLAFDGIDLSGQDGRESRFVECALTGCTLDETRLDESHLVETTIAAARGTTVHLRDGSWRQVTWVDCRLGALLATGARLDGVTVRGGKIDFLALAGATVHELRLEGVWIGELGLGGATVRRLTLVDCRVDRIDAAGATLRECDLRGGEIAVVDGIAGLAGATINEDQAVALAPALAAALRIRVQ
ncbi:MAG: hypothetical protein KQH57_01935 [Actinomycetales bacterium]|nr:hypothetical protein [Actinomycetales bacterium]